jgi:hypothetical protein
VSSPPEAADDEDFQASDAWQADDAVVGFYYRGVLARVSHGLELGMVRSASGREIPFHFQHVVVMGEGGAAGLSQGQVVGFDVGWTSHGLVVTRIQPVTEAPGPRSER